MHRDIKTENMFIFKENELYRLVYADLGFTKRIYQVSGTVCGTGTYMAPEILEGSQYNSLVDVWSLGCTLYYLYKRAELFDYSVKLAPLQHIRQY